MYLDTLLLDGFAVGITPLPIGKNYHWRHERIKTMTEPSNISPELDRLTNAVHSKRYDGQLDNIRRFLDSYLTARKEKELREAKEKTWRHRIAKFFR
jgi:hypothetical protein